MWDRPKTWINERHTTRIREIPSPGFLHGVPQSSKEHCILQGHRIINALEHRYSCVMTLTVSWSKYEGVQLPLKWRVITVVCPCWKKQPTNKTFTATRGSAWNESSGALFGPELRRFLRARRIHSYCNQCTQYFLIFMPFMWRMVLERCNEVNASYKQKTWMAIQWEL